MKIHPKHSEAVLVRIVESDASWNVVLDDVAPGPAETWATVCVFTELEVPREAFLGLCVDKERCAALGEAILQRLAAFMLTRRRRPL